MNPVSHLLSEFPDDADDRAIESTASDLESMNYEPMLLIDTPGFFRMKKAELGETMNRVLQLPAGQATDAVKSGQIKLLAYYYDLLCRLRLNDAEAWDLINELYEDD